jgi:hypothetical protein
MSGYYEFAGDKIVLTHEEGRDVVTFGDTGTGRECGTCQLCCKVMPVAGPPLNKPAGVRCKHQRTGKGCGIYATRPLPCRVFACRWLADRETAGMPRPDRCHYVIDLKDDYVEQVLEDGTRTRIGVVQVWVDPHFRDSYRRPELRAYMLRIAERCGQGTIVRFSSREAITIFPPPLCADGEWHEIGDGVMIVDRDEMDRRVMEDAARYKVGTVDAEAR